MMVSQKVKKRAFPTVSLSSEGKKILGSVFFFALGVGLNSLSFLFGTHPFALALFCASSRFSFPVLLGATVSAYFIEGKNVASLLTFFFACALRILSSLLLKSNSKKTLSLGETIKFDTLSSLFCENHALRVGVCALCVFAENLYTVLSHNYLYYDIFVMLFDTVFCSLFCYSFLFLFENDRFSARFYLGVGALFFCGIYALRTYEIFGFNLAMIFCFFLVLYLARYQPLPVCALVGFLFGLCFSVEVAPTFALFGLCFGALYQISFFLALLSGLVLGVGFAIYQTGYEALVSLLPECLFASLFFSPFLYFEKLPKLPAFSSSVRTLYRLRHEQELKERSEQNTTAFLEKLTSYFSALQEQEKKPTQKRYEELTLALCEESCATCPKQNICWQKEIDVTEKNLSQIANKLYHDQTVQKSDIDERFYHRCPQIDVFLNACLQESQKMEQTSLKSSSFSFLGRTFSLFSTLLAEQSAEREEQSTVNEEETARFQKLLSSLGVVYQDASVFSKSSSVFCVYGVDIERCKCSTEQLKNAVEKTFSLCLNLPTVTEEKDSSLYTLSFARVNELSVKVHEKSICKDGERVSGDSFCFFSSECTFYACLCDGMGSGEEARACSSLSVKTLSLVLSEISSVPFAVALLNEILKQRLNENSCTLDLFSLDCQSKEGAFYKCGACTSFVKRKDEVFELRASTSPIGILPEIDCQNLVCDLQKGDLVLLLTDGFLPSDKTASVRSFFKSYHGSPDCFLDAFAQERVQSALKNDDMTALLLEIC